jgi:hypothetical protein
MRYCKLLLKQGSPSLDWLMLRIELLYSSPPLPKFDPELEFDKLACNFLNGFKNTLLVGCCAVILTYSYES